MSIRVFGVLLSTLFFPALLAAQPVSFQICAESTTWVRPSPEVQAKVWNMPRYDASDRTATAWTHDRSEERRVRKECRSRWSPYHLKKMDRKYGTPIFRRAGAYAIRLHARPRHPG